MNHAYLDRLTASSNSIGLSVDYGQKRELGGVTITRGLTSSGRLQKGVYSLISRTRMPAVRGISPFRSEIGSRDRVEHCVAVRLIG